MNPVLTRWQNEVVARYPDPAIEILDDRFADLTLRHAAVERLWTGGRWLEGPVWFGDGAYVLFSDIPEDTISRWDETTRAVTVYRRPSGHANGHTRDRQGRLVSCEHLNRRVTRTEHDGTLTVLADRFEGHRLNSPNDVVVSRDGAVWFTDPDYGIRGSYEGVRAEAEVPRQVYRLDPDDGHVRSVAAGLDQPNGLCFSPDERLLYVVDVDHIRVFDVAGPRLHGGRVFVPTAPAMADGIRVDTQGNVWAAMQGGAGVDGVHCFAPDGTLLGRVHLPETPANLCFGGAKKNRLFVAASRSLYSLFVAAQGAQTP